MKNFALLVGFVGAMSALPAAAEEARRVGAWTYLPFDDGAAWYTNSVQITGCEDIERPSATLIFACEEGALEVSISSDCNIPEIRAEWTEVTIQPDEYGQTWLYRMRKDYPQSDMIAPGGGIATLLARRIATAHYAHAAVGSAQFVFNIYGLDRVIQETENGCISHY